MYIGQPDNSQQSLGHTIEGPAKAGASPHDLSQENLHVSFVTQPIRICQLYKTPEKVSRSIGVLAPYIAPLSLQSAVEPEGLLIVIFPPAKEGQQLNFTKAQTEAYFMSKNLPQGLCEQYHSELLQIGSRLTNPDTCVAALETLQRLVDADLVKRCAVLPAGVALVLDEQQLRESVRYFESNLKCFGIEKLGPGQDAADDFYVGEFSLPGKLGPRSYAARSQEDLCLAHDILQRLLNVPIALKVSPPVIIRNE